MMRRWSEGDGGVGALKFELVGTDGASAADMAGGAIGLECQVVGAVGANGEVVCDVDVAVGAQGDVACGIGGSDCVGDSDMAVDV